MLDWATEQALTERFLTPAQPGLEALFLEMRASLDPELRLAQPTKQGKPYPLGQCLEISLAVQSRLRQLDPFTLAGAPAEGHAALTAFLRHGGSARQVWGDLRGEYFQNAFLIGTLYIDASNDTVVPTKPPVEMLPFADAQFGPIKDYRHFASMAERYWKAHLFPNHVLPELAPYFPLITVTPDGGVRLESDSNYMVALTHADNFLSSEAVLDAPPMNGELFQLLVGCFADSSLVVASDPLKGQALALWSCGKYRAERKPLADDQRAVIVSAVREANRRLTRLTVKAWRPL